MKRLAELELATSGSILRSLLRTELEFLLQFDRSPIPHTLINAELERRAILMDLRNDRLHYPELQTSFR